MTAHEFDGWLVDEPGNGIDSCTGRHGRCAAECSHTLVYFIQEGTDGPIKIGHGWRVLRRLVGLQNGNPRPLRLIGTCPGGKRLEKTLHDRFADARIRGEWFEPSADLIALIASLPRNEH